MHHLHLPHYYRPETTYSGDRTKRVWGMGMGKKYFKWVSLSECKQCLCCQKRNVVSERTLFQPQVRLLPPFKETIQEQVGEYRQLKRLCGPAWEPECSCGNIPSFVDVYVLIEGLFGGLLPEASLTMLYVVRGNTWKRGIGSREEDIRTVGFPQGTPRSILLVAALALEDSPSILNMISLTSSSKCRKTK